MQLLNFQLGGDGISLDWQDQNIDLHNCFDFQRISYNVHLQQLEVNWLRSPEEWAKEITVPGLTLVFSGVSFFRVKERAVEYAFTEDSYLMHISFHPVEQRDEFDSISLSSSFTDDLTFFFQSEWGFKINAASVELLPLASRQ